MKPIEPIDSVRNLREYKVVSQQVWHVEDASDLLKLDWNEATISPQAVRRALGKFVRSGRFNWYPDVASAQLTTMLSAYCNVRESEILTFHGSDSALETVLRVYCEKGTDVTWVTPSYDQFRVFAQSIGAHISQLIVPPLGTEVDVDGLVAGICNLRTKILYFNNPNNPIGYLISSNQIERILQRLDQTLVLLDEAYIEFSGDSAVRLIQQYPNLIVFRSFSKAFGIAGIRLGYIVSDHRNLLHINKLRNGKNVTMFAQIAAMEQLGNLHTVRKHVESVVKAREYFVKQLRAAGVECFNSKANFVLVRVKKPEEFVLVLQKNGIFVRDRSFLPALENTVRITIGTLPQMRRVFKVISEEAAAFAS